MHEHVHHPEGWSLDGDTIKGPRDEGYPPLFRVDGAELEDVALALAAPAMLAALRRIAENGDALSGEECAEIAASAYTTNMYEDR